MRRLAALAPLVVLVACNAPLTDPSAISQCGEEPSYDRAESVAKEAVAKLPLIDPDSATVRDIRIDGPRKWSNIQGTFHGWQISFMLNSKNRMGGYAGPRKWLVLILPDGRWASREGNAWDS